VAGERTESPTQKRRDDARKRGQVPRSREVDSALVILAAFVVLRVGGGAMWEGMQSLMIESFEQLDRAPLTIELTSSMGMGLMLRAVLLLAPLMGAIVVLSLIGGMAQTGGPLFSAEAAKPQFKRMNPMEGGKRLFASKQSYMNLLKTLLKFGVFGLAALLTFRAHWEEMVSLGLAFSIAESVALLVEISFDLVLKVTIALVVFAAADFVFQRYDIGQQLRMTLQEVKDESRQSEGDPHVKAQLARARRSLLARAMQAVPKADVVIVNPTHFAVALRYDPATSRAPIVLAKGTQLMAARIREIAEENRIPIITNPPLCRAIYKAVRIGPEITPELYEAVAEILAVVYRLRTGGVRRAAA
jgi:flagellar biosynthetic protein FlhB